MCVHQLKLNMTSLRKSYQFKMHGPFSRTFKNFHQTIFFIAVHFPFQLHLACLNLTATLSLSTAWLEPCTNHCIPTHTSIDCHPLFESLQHPVPSVQMISQTTQKVEEGLLPCWCRSAVRILLRYLDLEGYADAKFLYCTYPGIVLH